MLSTGWPKLGFFCPRLFPAETPQKSPKVAISATTSERCARQQGPSAKGWQHQDSRQQHSPGHQRRAVDRAHGGTHPAKSWPAARAARTRPRAGHQNAPGAVIACRARGCPGLVGLCVLGRLKVNRPLGHARQAQAAISLIAKSTSTAALRGSAPGWIRRTAWPGAGHQHAQQHQDSRQQHSPGHQRRAVH